MIELETIDPRSELGAKEITLSEIETREEAMNELAEAAIEICSTDF